MKRFVEGEDRLQGALLPHCLDDYVTENNPVRVIEAFIDELHPTSAFPDRAGKVSLGASSPIRRVVSHRLQSADSRPSRRRLGM